MNDDTRFRILLVEDDPADAGLVKRAIRDGKILCDLTHVRDGEEGLAYLHRHPPFADAQRPDLILLDLNMPRMDGREVLAEIVADDDLKHLPVVILTTSSDEQEILEMYNLRCSSYIVKPVDFEQFQRVIKLLRDYWFTVVVLPDPKKRRTG